MDIKTLIFIHIPTAVCPLVTFLSLTPVFLCKRGTGWYTNEKSSVCWWTEGGRKDTGQAGVFSVALSDSWALASAPFFGLDAGHLSCHQMMVLFSLSAALVPCQKAVRTNPCIMGPM